MICGKRKAEGGAGGRRKEVGDGKRRKREEEISRETERREGRNRISVGAAGKGESMPEVRGGKRRGEGEDGRVQ